MATIREVLAKLPESSLPIARELNSECHYLITYDPNLVDRSSMNWLIIALEKQWGIKALGLPVNMALTDPIRLFALDKPPTGGEGGVEGGEG